MTNTIIICHVLTPPAKYEKFIVGSQPMRMREYTTMNNNKQLLDEVFVICRIINVEVRVISRAEGEADNSYRDIDNFAYHKNRIQ